MIWKSHLFILTVSCWHGKALAYLELRIQAEQTGIVLDQPGLFGFVQETHQQEQFLQREARQRLLVA